MKKLLGRYLRTGAPATKKFDLHKPFIRQNKIVLAVAGWNYLRLRKWMARSHVTKVRMEGLKPPYIIVCNHNAFIDFYVMAASLKPHTGIYPAAVDDFIGRELFLRCTGCVPKRKYTSDLNTVLQCKKALEAGENFGIYAEARYSLCGVTELDALTESLGQLVKMMGVPCVTFKNMGHHIYDPFWGNHIPRFPSKVEAVFTQLFTAEEIKKASVDEINTKIREAIYNDDWRWQSANRVQVKRKNRAEGLHKPLYMCPACKTEYKMDSEGAAVFCKACGKKWTLNYYGELEAENGETEFKFPSDWYLWEKQEVEKEVEEGRYYFESDCHVHDLPNSWGFVRLGNGRMVHDMTGFRVDGVREYDGEPFSMYVDSSMQNSLHVEYNYRFGQKKDCIDLNTMKDTWYVFPDNCEFSVTKMTFATEAIYKKVWKEKNIKKKNKE
ncbi:MAG: hypothetical protein E7523_12035 [Ruminococcaceae bacterium]|nr:hypothetical protein [Oscillospiraceae bacterium]